VQNEPADGDYYTRALSGINTLIKNPCAIYSHVCGNMSVCQNDQVQHAATIYRHIQLVTHG